MSHYLLEQSVTNEPSPFTRFFYPQGMFADSQTTINVLVSLEDAFIAACLAGVRHFSTADLRVTAARIMGIESDHRTLARVICADIPPLNGGPLEAVTGLQGPLRAVFSSDSIGDKIRINFANRGKAPSPRCR